MSSSVDNNQFWPFTSLEICSCSSRCMAALFAGTSINMSTTIWDRIGRVSNSKRNWAYLASPSPKFTAICKIYHTSYRESTAGIAPGTLTRCSAHPLGPSLRHASGQLENPKERGSRAAWGIYIGLEQTVKLCSLSGYLAARASENGLSECRVDLVCQHILSSLSLDDFICIYCPFHILVVLPFSLDLRSECPHVPRSL